jgi:hypothetical protein
MRHILNSDHQFFSSFNFDKILFSSSEEDSSLKIIINLCKKPHKYQYFDFLFVFLNLIFFKNTNLTKNISKPPSNEKILKKISEKKFSILEIKKILMKNGCGFASSDLNKKETTRGLEKIKDGNEGEPELQKSNEK